jgi:hypothetical protein
MPAKSKCAYNVLGECNNDNCPFAHKRNFTEWFAAPHMDVATARAIVGIKDANSALRNISKKKASLKASLKGKKKQVAKPASDEEVEEVEEVDKKVVAPKALLLSASLERKAVPQTTLSRNGPVSSGAPAGFLLQCHVASIGVANLAIGYTAGSEEKLAKILQILGTGEVVD